MNAADVALTAPQEVAVMWRRLARLQEEASRQGAALQAARSGGEMLQTAVCELTAEVARLSAACDDVHEQLGASEAIRTALQVQF